MTSTPADTDTGPETAPAHQSALAWLMDLIEQEAPGRLPDPVRERVARRVYAEAVAPTA